MSGMIDFSFLTPWSLGALRLNCKHQGLTRYVPTEKGVETKK